MAKRLHGGSSDLRKNKYKNHDQKVKANKALRAARLERQRIKSLETSARRGRASRRFKNAEGKFVFVKKQQPIRWVPIIHVHIYQDGESFPIGFNMRNSFQ